MKRKVLSIMVALFVLLSSTNAFAATAWLQDNESSTNGFVETEVVADAMNGTVELTTGNATTDGFPINYGEVEFTFTADPGYEVGTSGNSFSTVDPTQEGYYYSAEMRTLWPGVELDERVYPNIGQFYDLVVREISATQTEVVLGVSVVRNEVAWPDEVVYAHLEPELRATVSVNFTEIPVEEEYYYVRAVSSPSGVASFSGTGETFMMEDPYSVSYTILDSDYEFVEWQGEPSGYIEGNVDLVAVFRKKTTPPPVYYYTVSAVSNPAGVATFTGTGSNFVFGSAYDVQFTQVDDDYVFTGWSAANSGTISGDVSLVANFEPIVVPEFDVTAVSSPAGVATFDGTLADAADGTDYSVSIATVQDGYVFVEWLVSPTGTIDGADVEVIAVFEEEVEEILDEEIAEEIPDEELPEAGGIPTVAFSGLGLAVAAIGKKLRK